MRKSALIGCMSHSAGRQNRAAIRNGKRGSPANRARYCTTGQLLRTTKRWTCDSSTGDQSTPQEMQESERERGRGAKNKNREMQKD